MGRRPVVVGVDESEAGRDAAAIGHQIAEASSCPLHLVTAVRDSLVDVAATRVGFDTAAFHKEQSVAAVQGVRESLRTVMPASVLADRVFARIGRPEQVLSDYGSEVAAAMVVIGGKSRSGLGGWFRRGTAHHLLRTTERPLLVTGPGVHDIKRVIVALDGSQQGPRVLQLATWLAAILGAELHAVHVVDDTVIRTNRTLAPDLEELVKANVACAEDEIWPLLGSETTREVLIGPVARTLSQVAREKGPSLLVVGSHGLGLVNRMLLGSTTEELLSELPTSLAIAPSAPDLI